MERFIQLFRGFPIPGLSLPSNRIVIHGYLSGLSRPEAGGLFLFGRSLASPVVSKEVLSQRTNDLPGLGRGIRPQTTRPPIEWAEKRNPQRGTTSLARPAPDGEEERLRRLLHFQEHGAGPAPSASASLKFPTKDPNHRILAHQRSRFNPLLLLYPGRSSRPHHRTCGKLLFPSMPPTGSMATLSSNRN